MGKYVLDKILEKGTYVELQLDETASITIDIEWRSSKWTVANIFQKNFKALIVNNNSKIFGVTVSTNIQKLSLS